MSRDPYSSSCVIGPGGGTRSPRSIRRMGELPTVDRSPSRSYASGRGSPLGGRKQRGTRSGNNSPEHLGYGGGYHHHQLGSPYYSRDEDLVSPVMLEERGRSMSTGGGGGGHHRSRSASRPAMSSSAGMVARYTSLDRASAGVLDHGDREFMPIREPSRERSRDRGLYLEDELYGSRSARQSPNPHMLRDGGGYIGELQHQNNDLQRELGNLKKELELTNQKLGSSMHSIKTFWSPELKKERALRKEESTKYSLINEQLKLLNSENQKQSIMVRQLEEELRMRMRGPSVEMQQQMEVLYNENEHLTREIAILRDTIKELELRIETQKQTLQARDESIKKLLEMLQNKGMGKEEERIMFQQMQSMAQKQLDELRTEVQRRDQELLAMSAKMKTLEEQHQDYQRHIAVLKESLCAKEEHYNMLQADVEEMRQRLEEKNRMIEKKTQVAMQAQQERNRMNTELTEIKDHMDIKDRKINVLQRKVDLHEANKKLQAGAAKAGADTMQERKQMEELRRQLDEQRRQMEEKAKSVDQKARTIEERERTLQNLDQDLKKRKARMDQLEQQLQKSGGAPDKRLAEMQRALEIAERDLEKAKEESGRSAAETERLLQLVQMTQEEQNSKEKQIRDLQEALKTAQAKLKQATTAQQESQDNKDQSSWQEALEAKNRAIFELERTIKNLQMEHDKCKDLLSDAKRTESWKEETETLNQHIVQLEQQLRCEDDVNGHDKMSKNIETQTKMCKYCCNPNAKDRRILALERQVTALRNSLKNHVDTTELLEKNDSDKKINGEVEESWKQEIETKNRYIVELEQKIESLESLLRDNVDTQKTHELEKTIDRKSKRIVELEDAVEELEDFLKEDVKEMRDLRYQVSLDKEHIMRMEKWIQRNNLTNAGIDKVRIIELEEMVTSLEDYVREHDIDGLKRKLQDRECRIGQLENQISELKKLSRNEENKPVRDMSKVNILPNDGCELQEKEQKVKDIMHNVLKEDNRIQETESLKIELREKEQKMKEMGHDISEKDNKIQRYEQQIIEQQNKILKMEKEMAEMEEELYETEDISALKEEIRLRNGRVQELETEVNSLETSLGERIDVAIEELIATLKEKEEIELQLKKNLAEKERKLEELDAALRQSITITDEIETKFKYEKTLRKEADQRIAEMEEKIAIMQAASAAKCITCKPLLYKIFKTEEKLVQSNQEKTIQLQELHQIKREALKAALSEKDAHLALLEHSGITTPLQADQAAKLKADKKLLLDRLREEDEKSINLDFKQERIPQLFQKIFKIPDGNEDNSDNNNNSFDDRFKEISLSKSVTNGDSSPNSATTSCKYSTRTSMVSDLKDEDQSQIHQQDTR